MDETRCRPGSSKRGNKTNTVRRSTGAGLGKRRRQQARIINTPSIGAKHITVHASHKKNIKKNATCAVFFLA